MMQSYKIPAEMLMEDASPAAKLVAIAMLNGCKTSQQIQLITGLDRRRYAESKDIGESLFAKYNDIFSQDTSRTLVGQQADTSRTLVGQRPEYEIAMLKNVNDQFTRTVINKGQAVKRSDESLGLQVLFPDIVETSDYSLGGTPPKKEILIVPSKKKIGNSPPTLDEIIAYFKDVRNLSERLASYNGNRFFNYYELNGWSWGPKNKPLVKWKTAAANWRLDEPTKLELEIIQKQAKVSQPVEPERDKMKMLIPEVDEPEFALMPEDWQIFADDCNIRYYKMTQEFFVLYRQALSTPGGKIPMEELKEKHQYDKMLFAKFKVLEQFSTIKK